MTDALTLYVPEARSGDGPGNGDAGRTNGPTDAHGAPPFMDYRPPGDGHRYGSIRVFTDTMAVPDPVHRGLQRYAIGARVYVEPCAATPEYPAVYLVALRGAGYALARLVPMIGGGYHVRYDNPAYEGFTVHPKAVAAKVRVLARVVRETTRG